MAAEEIDYESDPEEAKLSLKMRRREASDDEDEADEGGNPRLRRIESDGESEGAPADYEEELDEEDDYGVDDEYVEDEVELQEEIDVEYGKGAVGGGKDGMVATVEREESGKEGGFEEKVSEEKKRVSDEAGESNEGDKDDANEQHEDERKDLEPFSVPTAGAFYMHDDRFRDSTVGRHRRTLGGRKLWESKDDRKWGHDKFEELSIQDRRHEEGRRGARGRYRGRNRNRGPDHGSEQGNRPREYTNNSNQNGNNNNNNQNSAHKGVRGRGPRRYQPSFKNNSDAPVTQNEFPGKSVEKHPHVNSRKSSEPVSNAKPDVVPRKQVASNLNIASPPFYPTGSSTKDISVPTKRGAQAGIINHNGQQSAVDENFPMVQSTGTMRGKTIVNSPGLENLSFGDSSSAMARKPSNAIQSYNSGQPQFRAQGRGPASFAQMAYQPVSNNQLNRVPPPNHLQNVQRNPSQSRAQQSMQGSVQHYTRVPSGSQPFSPPKAAAAVNTPESGEVECALELTQPKAALVAKGKGNVPGSAKGSFLYGGAQVMGSTGSVGSGPGDQNFPAFLPVMNFGGQHQRGIGVPAVGMAFPGYVGQPQLGGLGNSEMTWLPVLAGAAGSLGATYCPPYITVDGSYNARPSGQSNSATAASSKENNAATKVGNDWKPSQRPELANDDLGQRQKNSRRYTEMKFDQ